MTNENGGWLRKLPFVGKKLADRFGKSGNVAVIRLYGVIGQAGLMKKGLNLQDLEESLEQAFEVKKLKAVALSINSPGGSPVQSALIAGRIRELAAKNEVPVYAFCEDAAASGGYWLACAGDEIYAQSASIVGSIGVISAGFGFTELIEKIGVERRVYTSGDSKSQLDPFKPEKKDDIKHLKELQNDIHEQFKGYVRARRDGKLQKEEKDLFNGNFWTGAAAADLGLVDGLGELKAVCRDKFGDKVSFKDVSKPKGWLQRKLGMESRLDAVGRGLMNQVEERWWWGRLGL
ncbi:S49 family peptidase [Aestuariispira ectoiniformans]|uniref:S49 family peptidase n=1 Tax=Aestuariispira ectoiniformans TaxID=2775080 RepID=UPI00223AD234|nr:S49 family peptidase [Aestuariispira ectoiniformans]